METNKIIKLNIGCGTDYREGFVNIDGSDSLLHVDRIVDISRESLRDYFNENSVHHILANDIIEHHFHWEAAEILKDFHFILAPEGTVEIRVPDTERILKSWRMPIRNKITLLYGGQDIPQGRDDEMDESRKRFPQFFCHKFGWTKETLSEELLKIGFQNVRAEQSNFNFVAHATKK